MWSTKNSKNAGYQKNSKNNCNASYVMTIRIDNARITWTLATSTKRGHQNAQVRKLIILNGDALAEAARHCQQHPWAKKLKRTHEYKRHTTFHVISHSKSKKETCNYVNSPWTRMCITNTNDTENFIAHPTAEQDGQIAIA